MFGRFYNKCWKNHIKTLYIVLKSNFNIIELNLFLNITPRNFDAHFQTPSRYIANCIEGISKSTDKKKTLEDFVCKIRVGNLNY